MLNSREDDGVVVITDWVVGEQGRLTIPAEKRDKYGIEPGDYVDGAIILDHLPDDAEDDTDSA